jgi:hypothetical protein
MKIDMDKVLAVACEHMSYDNDLRWSVGAALEELYPQEIKALQDKMVQAWIEKLNKGEGQ